MDQEALVMALKRDPEQGAITTADGAAFASLVFRMGETQW